jgi:hypothetical protein
MIKWWAYLHTNGRVVPQYYTDDSYMDECVKSDFIKRWTVPFEAEHRRDATEIAMKMLIPGDK